MSTARRRLVSGPSLSGPSLAPPQQAPPCRRRALPAPAIALLGALGVLGVLLVGAAAARRSIAEHLIEWGLGSAGIELGAVSVEALAHSHLTVRDLQIVRPVDLSIHRLVTRYSWASLADASLTSIDARGVRLRAALPAQSAAAQPVPTGEPTVAGSPAGAAPTAWDPGRLAAALASVASLPARRIDLTELRIELASAENTIEIGGELHAKRTDDLLEASTQMTIEGPSALGAGVALLKPIDIELGLEVKPDGFRAALAPAALRIAFGGSEPLLMDAVTPVISARLSPAEPRAPARIEVEGAGGLVTSRRYGLEASGFALHTAFSATAHPQHTEIRVANLRDLRRPARFPPLALLANLESSGSQHAFEIALRDQQERIALHVRGHRDTARDRISAEFHLLPTTFASGGLQPADLLQPLAGSISNVSGTVEALGSAHLSGLRAAGGALRELQMRVDLALRDLSLDTPLSTLRALNGSIHIDGSWPPSTPPGQTLQIGLIDVGVPLTDALVSFQLNEDLSVTLEEALLHFASGILRTEGRVDLTAPEQTLTLEVSGLELEALFELLAIGGLTGSGSVAGAIPIARTNDSIEIRDGRLSNRSNEGGQRGAGWIRYRPGAGVQAAAADQSQLSTALEALGNFHYEELDLHLSGDPSRGVELSLHLTGSNPDFHDGYPVSFNLNLEAPLSGLHRTVSYSREISDRVERSLSSFGARAANFRRAGASIKGGDPLDRPGSDR